MLMSCKERLLPDADWPRQSNLNSSEAETLFFEFLTQRPHHPPVLPSAERRDLATPFPASQVLQCYTGLSTVQVTCSNAGQSCKCGRFSLHETFPMGLGAGQRSQVGAWRRLR